MNFQSDVCEGSGQDYDPKMRTCACVRTRTVLIGGRESRQPMAVALFARTRTGRRAPILCLCVLDSGHAINAHYYWLRFLLLSKKQVVLGILHIDVKLKLLLQLMSCNNNS